MKPFFEITADHLVGCLASELKPGYVFYLKDGDKYLRCVLDLAWYPTNNTLAELRKELTRVSKAGLLYRRRDKAWEDFRDMNV